MAPSRSYSQREHRRITSKFRGKFRKMRNRCELIVFSLSTDHAQDFSLQRGIFCCKIYCAISIQSSCLRKQLIERSILFSFTFSIWLITSIKEQVQLSLFLIDTEIFYRSCKILFDVKYLDRQLIFSYNSFHSSWPIVKKGKELLSGAPYLSIIFSVGWKFSVISKNYISFR